MVPGEVVLTLSGREWCAAHRDAAIIPRLPVSRGRSALESVFPVTCALHRTMAGAGMRSRYSKCRLKDFAYRAAVAAGRFERSPVAHTYLDSDCTRGHP